MHRVLRRLVLGHPKSQRRQVDPSEHRLALSPVVLGQGEAVFAGIDLPALGLRVTEHQATEHAMHVVLAR